MLPVQKKNPYPKRTLGILQVYNVIRYYVIVYNVIRYYVILYNGIRDMVILYNVIRYNVTNIQRYTS